MYILNRYEYFCTSTSLPYNMKCEVSLSTFLQNFCSIGQIDYRQVSCLQVHDAGITTTRLPA
jgi:hypothetical protein